PGRSVRATTRMPLSAGNAVSAVSTVRHRVQSPSTTATSAHRSPGPGRTGFQAPDPRVDRDERDEGEERSEEGEQGQRQGHGHRGHYAAQRPVSTDSASTTWASPSDSGARPDSGPRRTRSMPSVGPAIT